MFYVDITINIMTPYHICVMQINCAHDQMTHFQNYFVEGLEPFTKYEMTLQVKNPEHLSPPDTISGVTSQGGKNALLSYT